MGFFRRTKDRLIEKTAPAVLNETLFHDYGEITSIELDSGDKSLHLEALLHGEKDTIRVEILLYEIVQCDGRDFFVAKKLRTSRQWITTLAKQQIVGRPIPLPQQLRGLISKLL